MGPWFMLRLLAEGVADLSGCGHEQATWESLAPAPAWGHANSGAPVSCTHALCKFLDQFVHLFYTVLYGCTVEGGRAGCEHPCKWVEAGPAISVHTFAAALAFVWGWSASTADVCWEGWEMYVWVQQPLEQAQGEEPHKGTCLGRSEGLGRLVAMLSTHMVRVGHARASVHIHTRAQHLLHTRAGVK